MRTLILDLHIHSRYARACSPRLELPAIAEACRRKGVDVVSSADFTHPLWRAQLREHLEEVGESGLFALRGKACPTRFMLGTEVACIYRHRERTRRLHLLLFAPDFECVTRLCRALEKRNAKLDADGRPILGLSAKALLALMLELDPRMVLVPAHAWTPWFAVFGSKSGYDSLEECFEELTPNIRAVETGLSSDPPMNRRLKALDACALISNSDAHSLEHIGREANVLAFEERAAVTYDGIWRRLHSGDPRQFLHTIEFYPEEGMYYHDGHRACAFVCAPEETKRLNALCPRCAKPLTLGVLHRVEALAERTAQEGRESCVVPARYCVPLREIIAGVFEVGVGSKRVSREYEGLIEAFGNEFALLLEADVEAIARVAGGPGGETLARAIQNMRCGRLRLSPGFDGQYGRLDLLP